MAHAIGSASISFGLVSIPVKLHASTRSSESISFNLLHEKCGSRLKQQYICAQDGELVERSAMVKGYEFAKGRYVILTDEEIKSFEEKATQAIDIDSFVPGSTVEPLFFEKAYFLSPGRGGERAYALLAEAMKQSGRWAVARYAARGRQYLVCLRPVEGALVMQQLYYADQIRQLSDLEIPQVELREPELKMAVQLTELGAADSFEPELYRDEVRNRMRELIDRKIAGEDISELPAEEPRAQVVDLMEALRQSLAAGGKKTAAASDRKPAKRAARQARDAEPQRRPVAVKKSRSR